ILVLGSVFGLTLLYLFFQQRSIRAKHQHSELEHRFLRFQLNPHFIFNALASIQNYMLKNNSKDAGIYLAKFSKLMRQILENSRQEFIPIAEEVIMLENYLDVHQLNTIKPFTYEINIDENIDQESVCIPPMFIQPFVENAIEHGISKTTRKGEIGVSIRKEDDSIHITIRDNGIGINATTKTPEHKSLASKIIQERIAVFNKSLKNKIQIQLEEVVENNEVMGTLVRLKLPYHFI
ncbi:MAG: histidine kinase, partial [Ekhidna sp.]